MAITISCCLNNPPPPGFPSSATKNTTQQLASLKNDQKWRNQCVLGMACMIIGLEINEPNLAPAVQSLSTLEMKAPPKTRRWSDRRTCPPWRLNSLETIVPENLPRPSARRRWEATGYSKMNDLSPDVEDAVKRIVIVDGCFTLTEMIVAVQDVDC
ncbi:protein CHLOROPLAST VESICULATION isoform X2 [Mercurialis annua]|uniref:protein CHLOROPLAST VESICULATION isoform X2 n=2 Tax=Mercurialis annua TaxID=3986 RepID=UPI00215E7A77|nr:protein CHLOROPLAST VESICULATION isoform X2 [Mercurialis annua]